MMRLWGERAWFSRLLDLVYPGVCRLCREGVAEGRCLCPGCRDGLRGLKEPFCDKCGEEFAGVIDEKFECPDCRGQSFAFEFARPAMGWSAAGMELVRDLKYSRRLELASELGELAWRSFKDPRLEEALAGSWPLVPVPLHRRRKRWRHFNQASEVARVLGGVAGLPVVEALLRMRWTSTQTRLSRVQRQQNLKGAFEIVKGFQGGPGAVLVDDVFTTGSTVNECAKVLKKAGVQKVVVVTVMRG